MTELSLNTEPEMSEQQKASAAQIEQNTREMKAQQNLPLALIGGFVAAVAAALLWATITYLTGFQIGYMAIGVGFIVGFTVRFLGKGIDITFGIIGAFFALVGCVLGNLFAVIMSSMQIEGVLLSEVLGWLIADPGIILAIYQETFSLIDLLFYAIAIYVGFKFSLLSIDPE